LGSIFNTAPGAVFFFDQADGRWTVPMLSTLDRLGRFTQQVFDLDSLRYSCLVLTRWCRKRKQEPGKVLGGGASCGVVQVPLGSGPVMSAVSADGVEGTGESIEIESGDDHT
jgi:hypothetical protein